MEVKVFIWGIGIYDASPSEFHGINNLPRMIKSVHREPERVDVSNPFFMFARKTLVHPRTVLLLPPDWDFILHP